MKRSFPLKFLVQAILLSTLTACGGGSDPDAQGGSPGPDTGIPGGQPPVEEPTQSTVLPRVYINTEGAQPVTSKDDYIDAVVRIESEVASEVTEVTTKIRGRGNTTWGMPKKPYRLKLDEAASLLGMPAERNWALLANYSDKSLVRNKLGMTLGELAGLAYNPRSRYVEVYFNGQYEGVYEFFEHREVSPVRVNIDPIDKDTDTDPYAITGGWFLEADWRRDEDVCWDSSLNVTFCAKDPELEQEDIADPSHPSYAQFNYITTYINAAEQALEQPGSAWTEYLDEDAAVNWYLVQELLRNNDANMHSSVFLYKPRGGKLFFGPLWDFDIAAGNIDYNGNDSPIGWYMRTASPWHARLHENTDFTQRVFARWCELREQGVIDGLADQVDKIVAGIDRAAIDRNFQRWPILGTYVWPNSFIGQTYEEEVDFLKTWLTQRAEWMHAEYVAQYGECPATH